MALNQVPEASVTTGMDHSGIQAKAERVLETHEEVFEAIDEWLDASPDGTKDREYHVRRTHLGHYCTLSIRGNVVAFAHARGSDLAIEHALRNFYEAE